MPEHQHRAIIDAAQRDTEKIRDANADRHPHAANGTAQHDALAMKLDLPHAAIGARVVGVVAHGQGKRVEPQCAARSIYRWGSMRLHPRRGNARHSCVGDLAVFR